MRNTAGPAASGTRGGEGRRRARVPSLLRAVAVALVAVLTASGCAREPLVQPLKGDLARRITIEGRPFEYCASAAIEDLPAEVTRVIIAVHGLDTKTKLGLLRLALFWHFLDIVWIFIFSVVYLPGVA